MLVKYIAILNIAILWFISSKKVDINMCLKQLSFRNKKILTCSNNLFLKEAQLELVKNRKTKTGFTVLLMK